MHITRRRGMLVGGLLALALSGATGIAIAQSSNGNDKAPAREHDDAGPGKTSSVTVPAAQAATEADEGTALQGLAKITQDQAKAAAVAAVPGDATKVELENEDGGAGANGTRTDLVIDAGNGAVLSRETETEAKRSVDEAPDGRGGSDEAGEAPEVPGD